jgi:hypothetical protein
MGKLKIQSVSDFLLTSIVFCVKNDIANVNLPTDGTTDLELHDRNREVANSDVHYQKTHRM